MPSYLYLQKGVVFVRVPKTGSSSIRHAFLTEKPPPEHRFFSPIPKQYANMKSFAFVRHPISRLASAMSMFHDDFGERLTVDWIFQLIMDDHVNVGKDTPYEKLKLHVIPMTHSHFGLDAVKRIFRFERFESEWQSLADYLGVQPPSMMHLKTSNNPKPIFNEQELRDIREFFSEDFERFGYE